MDFEEATFDHFDEIIKEMKEHEELYESVNVGTPHPEIDIND